MILNTQAKEKNVMVENYCALIHGGKGTGKSYLCKKIMDKSLADSDSNIVVFSSTEEYDNSYAGVTNKRLKVFNKQQNPSLAITFADLKEKAVVDYFKSLQDSTSCLVIIDSISLSNNENELLAMMELLFLYKESHIFSIFVTQDYNTDIEKKLKTSQLFNFVIRANSKTESMSFYRFFASYIYGHNASIDKTIITDPKGEVYQSKEVINTDIGTKPIKTLLVSIERQNSDISMNSISGEFLDIDANNLFSGFVEYLNDKTKKLVKEPKVNLADFYSIPETATVKMILHGPMDDFTYDAELPVEEAEKCFNYMTMLMTTNIDSPDLLEQN